MRASKKSSLSFFIALVMTPASVLAADWVQFSSTDGQAIFMDQSSARKIGGALQVWTLVNLTTPDPSGARSLSTAYLLNCETWESASRAGADHSEIDGKGKVIYSYTVRPDQIQYTPAMPGTVNDAMLRTGCGISK